jgi:hypothetical protein
MDGVMKERSGSGNLTGMGFEGGVLFCGKVLRGGTGCKG